MKTKKLSVAISCLSSVLCGLGLVPLKAEVKMPSLFGDHMVLQEGRKIPIWGTADPDEKVTVTLGSSTATATAGSDGNWRVTLDGLSATSAPLLMTVAGKNTLTFQDVLVGEVWFASGQSNMALPLSRTLGAAEEIAQANDPQLRFFCVKGPLGLDPAPVKNAHSLGEWTLATPETVPQYSAVAYYFAKELRTKLKKPVAIIQSAVGGTLAEAWTPIDALRKHPELKKITDIYDKAQASFASQNAAYPDAMKAWQEEHNKWLKEVGTTYNPLLAAWQTEVEKARLTGEEPPPQPKPSRPAPRPPAVPYGGNNTPSVLYNGLVAPVIPYAIRGAIWYQGESNAKSSAPYHLLLSTMITSWRERWGEGDFPFLIVQLPNYSRGANWPQIREAQAQVQASLPNTFLATAIDIGDANNLHPVNKLVVGKRLALVARHAAYGENDLVWTGPIYDSMKVEGNTIRVRFTQTGSGLAIGNAPWVPPLSKPIPTSSLVGFAVADDQQRWFPAEAKIDGTTVVVSSDKVTAPTAVRYAWQNAPECNLANKEGLGAAPFRTDDWKDLGEVPAVTSPVPPSVPVKNTISPTAPPPGSALNE